MDIIAVWYGYTIAVGAASLTLVALAFIPWRKTA